MIETVIALAGVAIVATIFALAFHG